MLNFLRLVFWLEGWKKDIASNWGSQFGTKCSSVIEGQYSLAFISTLGPNNKPKILRGGLCNFFQP
jgi:hypothetical protein